jgi:nitrous oxidase accessory protein NosD
VLVARRKLTSSIGFDIGGIEMVRSLRLVVVLAALLVMLVAGTGSARAAAKVVVGPGDSIQAAVDAARPGDTIVVKGRHRENVAITTDGITLRGLGAVLAPAATPKQNACFDPSAPADVIGICVVGDVNFDTGEVIREVRDVTVSGFTIHGFSFGIGAFGAHDATFKHNVATGNAEYGITAFVSTGTRMLFNRASDSGEAGFYIGDSPAADATLIGNSSSGSLFGILIRNALHGKAAANSIHGNCVGVGVLADLPGPAGLFHLTGNLVRNNTRACAASEELPFPLSGVGIALLGANGVKIDGNLITGNVPSAETDFSGGVVVASGVADPLTAPADNRVRGNRILHNDPDVFWDGTGSGNSFRGNLCRTSTPAGLCHGR